MALSWQERYEQKLAAQRDAAHERFMASRRRFAEANPNAMSPQEYRQTMFGNAEDKGGLMAHEKEMLKEKSAADIELQGKKNEGELAVAQEKRAGMREQGADAAKANAEAAQAVAEREWATKQSIAELENETKRYGMDKDLEGKKYGADAAVDAEEMRGKGNLAIAEQQGKDAIEAERIRAGGAERVAEIQAKATAQKQNTPKVMTEKEESDAAMKIYKESNGRISYEQALEQVRRQYRKTATSKLDQFRQ